MNILHFFTKVQSPSPNGTEMGKAAWLGPYKQTTSQHCLLVAPTDAAQDLDSLGRELWATCKCVLLASLHLWIQKCNHKMDRVEQSVGQSLV